MYYSNIIALQNTILLAKVFVGSAKKKGLIIDTPNIKVM